MTLKTIILGSVLAVAMATPVLADPIEGTWKRPNGHIVQFASCGAQKFCATAKTGPNAGKSVGVLSATGDGNYKGSLSDPAKGKTYTGKGSINGGTLRVSGCVLGGLICQGENWSRQ